MKVYSRSWWWTGKPGMLQSMGLQTVGHNGTTNWLTNCIWKIQLFHCLPSPRLPLIRKLPTSGWDSYLYRTQLFNRYLLSNLTELNWTEAHHTSLSFTISWSLLKLTSVESVMPSNHLTPCCPLLLPSIFASIHVFSNELDLRISWPYYWSFSFSPSSEYSRLISFRMDWFHLLIIQGTLKSLLQHHSTKASILQHLAFFIVQLSHPYMTTGYIALTRWTLLAK